MSVSKENPNCVAILSSGILSRLNIKKPSNPMGWLGSLWCALAKARRRRTVLRWTIAYSDDREMTRTLPVSHFDATLNAAETGHLVPATMHSAKSSIKAKGGIFISFQATTQSWSIWNTCIMMECCKDMQQLQHMLQHNI